MTAEWVAPEGLTAAEACRLAQRELARRDGRVFLLETLLETLFEAASAAGAPSGAEFPGRSLRWTGAEASLIGAAGGLALAGKVPLVNLPSSAALIRGCEQVRLDLCYHRANAKLFGSLDGTEAAIEDLALARSMPNLTVLAPADATATYHATLAAGAHVGPVYVRLPRSTAQVYSSGCRLTIGQGIVLREGSDLTLAAAGSAVAEASAASDLLRRGGIGARVLDLHTIKPVDRALLRQAAEETGLILTIEEHPVRGGLGGAVAEALGDECPVPMRILGIPDACRQTAGTRDEVLRRWGLDAAGIAAAARQTLERQAA